MSVHIKLSDQPLLVEECLQLAADPAAGAVDIFVGTVREWTRGRKVVQLEFEAYEPMAIREMTQIAERAVDAYELCKLVMWHRTGTLSIGDVPVIIAASAPHRGAAFEACRYAIDTLKETVPIWKKEIFSDGEVWVAAHP